jgi:hypothetical protein
MVRLHLYNLPRPRIRTTDVSAIAAIVPRVAAIIHFFRFLPVLTIICF